MKNNDNYTTTIDRMFKADATKGSNKRAAILAAARLDSKAMTAKQKAEVEEWLKSIK